MFKFKIDINSNIFSGAWQALLYFHTIMNLLEKLVHIYGYTVLYIYSTVYCLNVIKNGLSYLAC